MIPQKYNTKRYAGSNKVSAVLTFPSLSVSDLLALADSASDERVSSLAAKARLSHIDNLLRVAAGLPGLRVAPVVVSALGALCAGEAELLEGLDGVELLGELLELGTSERLDFLQRGGKLAGCIPW